MGSPTSPCLEQPPKKAVFPTSKKAFTVKPVKAFLLVPASLCWTACRDGEKGMRSQNSEHHPVTHERMVSNL